MAITTEQDYQTAQEQANAYLGTTGFSSLEDLTGAVSKLKSTEGLYYMSRGKGLQPKGLTPEDYTAAFSEYTPEQQKYLQNMFQYEESFTNDSYDPNPVTYNPGDYTPISQLYSDISTYEKLGDTSTAIASDSTTKSFQDFYAIAQEATPEEIAAAGVGSAFEYAQTLYQQSQDIASQQEAAATGMPTTAEEVLIADYQARQAEKEKQQAFFDTVWGSEEDFATTFKDFFALQESTATKGVESQYEQAQIAQRKSLEARGISPESGLALAGQNQLLGMKAEAISGIQAQNQQNFLQMGLGMQPTNQAQLQGYQQQLGYYGQQQNLQAQQAMQQAGFAQQSQMAQLQYGWQRDLMQQQIDAQRGSALTGLLGTAAGTALGAYTYSKLV